MRTPSSSSANEKKSSSSTGVDGKMVVLKRGPWTAEEDELLIKCINREGEGKWRTLPIRAGLARCGKSCRLRWMNYLRPSVKRGQIAPDEEDLILRLHRLLGNRWSLIAGRIPGRTDNEIKNYWNTHLSKKLISQGIDPKTHKPLLETSTATYSKQLVGSKDGKKTDSNNNSGTSKIVTTTGTTPTSSGQNPNTHPQQYNSASVTDGFGEEDGQMVHGGFGDHASDGNEAGCYSDGYHRSNVDLDDAVGGYHVNLQQRPSQEGVSNEFDGGSDDGMNCEDMVEDDGVFSSFLNSLINDDMFV